ncbi:MAG: acetyl-CoA hydrolase/transferase family protein, partial [Candidatus Kapaibacterium sp.]
MNILTADEAVRCIESRHRVFIHSVAAAPQALIEAMTRRADELRDVDIVHLHTEGLAPYARAEFAKSFKVHVLFTGPNMREAVRDGRADYIPVFLSEVPLLFRRRVLPIDVALVQVTPPDAHGYCSLGVSVDATVAAVQTARFVVAQINPNMPRSLGDGNIHVSRFHAVTHSDDPILTAEYSEPDEIERAVGRHVAELVPDGATLQMGIGSIPNAVLEQLSHHKNLGIHTEMFSDGVVDLVERGVVTNSCKKKHPFKTVAGFVMGSQRLYDFIDDNPGVLLLDIAYVNSTRVIEQNPRVTAINSALEVDITGQVCADSLGSRIYSGVGGQMDFIRGAALCEDGKPIIALPSTTSKGESRIVCKLKPGAGVVTTRAHVHYVVTEYGSVNLYGKNLRERAELMISIAHPDHRERLAREVR